MTLPPARETIPLFHFARSRETRHASMAPDYAVRDIMTSPVTSVSQTSRLLDAAVTMRAAGIRHLPIVDGERVVGVLSERDVQRFTPSMLHRITEEEYNSIFENTRVDRVMTREPQCVEPETPLREALTLLLEKRVGCLPVVENGRLVGILTHSDLLTLLLRLLTQEAAQKTPGGH